MLLFLACVLDPTPTELTWYRTCGDPACSGYSGPFDGVPLCTTEAVGEKCAEEDVTCDPEDSCNALVVCAAEDPTEQEGGCPISRRDAKRDIRYLGDEERRAVASSALDLRLATWQYTTDPADRPPHLGFIIDDQPHSYAVAADGGHVDLYGYTSLAIATIQEQQRRLDAQDAKIAALEARLQAMEGR